MATFRLSSQAQTDIHLIFDYIASRHPQAAEEWVDGVVLKLELLGAHPFIGRVIDWGGPETRMIAHDNWLVFYRAEEKGILVLRAIDGRRDLSKIKLT